jgi:phenylpropionate dioxygenase-like ring-hydroxylating dioxygenase large terminal subunit
MIKNQWYVVLESDEVRTGSVIGVTRMSEKMIAWRDGFGKAVIMSDLCPHRGAALSIGAIHANKIQCPFHGFEYDTSGACTFIPANGKQAEPPKAMKVKTYPTREAHGFIYLWWGEPREEYPELPFFDAIGPDFVYATLRDPWPTHYSRAIENQLDVVHLPFVHRTTIGRGNRTLVNGPLTRVSQPAEGQSLLDIWVFNERDEGQKPRRASELPEPERHPFLQFLYPNLWHNWIAENIRVLVAFVPVDDENTLMYLRYYHKIKTPILRQINEFFGKIGNYVIERQDRPVVITQRPLRTDLDIGERLIPGDGPIITYRKIRRSLIEKAQSEASDSPKA